MSERCVGVEAGASRYEVHIAPGLAGLGEHVRARFPAAGRVALVTDATVAGLWGRAAVAELARAGLSVGEVVLPAGEAHKTLETWARCVGELIALGVDRKTPVIAFGGGVVGDVAGFAAASVMRGAPLVQVPTTLLSAVDSSVGGKTGFNLPVGKNLVGAFYQPSLVYVPLEVLDTLPEREWASGFGEVLKAALVGDVGLLAGLERAERGPQGWPRSELAAWIEASVRVKAEVVASDPDERGLRAVLNLGHTVGHGLEAALGYGVLSHGAAVGLGVLAETRAARAAGLVEEPGLEVRIEALLLRLGLPVAAPAHDHDAVLSAMALDKKARGDTLVLPLLSRAGQVRLVPWPRAALSQLLVGL